MLFCQYKDIFGKPNEGVHSYRLFDIAVVDVGMTIIGGYLMHRYYFNKYMSLFEFILLLLLFGVFMHKIFCVKTTVHNIIFE